MRPTGHAAEVELYLLDANVLLALTHRQHVHHGRATAWLTKVKRWATTPLTEAALVRLLMNQTVVGVSLNAATALDVLASLRAGAGWQFLPDDSSLADPRIDLTGLMGHRQVTDLHLVNLAASHGAVLATFDSRLRSALGLDGADLIHLV
jgi:toxin-antitoxin system PIN domain toxin